MSMNPSSVEQSTVILKYERMKKYTFKGVKREGQEQVKSPEFAESVLRQSAPDLHKSALCRVFV